MNIYVSDTGKGFPVEVLEKLLQGEGIENGGSGFDLISWVHESNYEVQVIFLTSYAEFDYARTAISLNSVDYLLKPIDYTKLTEALRRAEQKVKKSGNLRITRRTAGAGRRTTGF